MTSVKPIGICTRPNCNSTTRIETDIGRPCLNHYCIGGTYRPVEPDELEGCKECYAEHVTTRGGRRKLCPYCGGARWTIKKTGR